MSNPVLLRAPSRALCKISPKHSLLNIDIRIGADSVSRTVAEEHALAKFPCLSAYEEQKSDNENNAPLPRNPDVFEYDIVDDGNVEQREDEHETSGNGNGKEFVGPHVCLLCQ
jgi:hypothetical protein